jgi:hypothetical protein
MSSRRWLESRNGSQKFQQVWHETNLVAPRQFVQPLSWVLWHWTSSTRTLRTRIFGRWRLHLNPVRFPRISAQFLTFEEASRGGTITSRDRIFTSRSGFVSRLICPVGESWEAGEPIGQADRWLGAIGGLRVASRLSRLLNQLQWRPTLRTGPSGGDDSIDRFCAVFVMSSYHLYSVAPARRVETDGFGQGFRGTSEA